MKLVLPDMTAKSEFRREYAVLIKTGSHAGDLIPITHSKATEFLAAGPTSGPHVELHTRVVRTVVDDWEPYDTDKHSDQP